MVMESTEFGIAIESPVRAETSESEMQETRMAAPPEIHARWCEGPRCVWRTTTKNQSEVEKQTQTHDA
jgi:hypothetical protein